MAKQLFINPEEVRQAGWIKFSNIPVNQYNRTVAEEKDNYGKENLLRIYHDMRLIREFEEMLYSIKTTNAYNGLEYNNPGPAHLSIGQEAAAVGQAYVLDVEDVILGSHRSHGEILAKGLSAIAKLPEQALLAIMEEYMDGRIWSIVEKAGQGQGRSLNELAIDFLTYGALAEIFAKETGYNQGLGGAMHAFFQPYGFYPN